MRIVYVAASPVPSIAANSIHVVKMAQAFTNDGHDTWLISPILAQKQEYHEQSELTEIYGVSGGFEHKMFRVLPFKGGIILHAVRSALYAKSKKADLFYCRCFVSAWIGSVFGLNTIFERHDTLASPGRKKIRRLIFAHMIRSKSLLKVVVITNALKQYFLEEFSLEEQRVIVAPDGADEIPEGIQPISSIKNSAQITAGYIGHLYEGRGIDIIISIAGKMPEVDFHIVGGKADDIKHWRGETKNLCNVTFHGHVTHNETRRFLMSFNFLLAPYQNKVMVHGGGDTAKWMSPLKVFEYMSVGTPILCSDIGVLKEVLQHNENAVLCTPNDPVSWQESLSGLIKDTARADKIGTNALRDFKQKYTWLQRAQNILRLTFKAG
jgi:glycosyltransferase involved in cell wall biosynthesis